MNELAIAICLSSNPLYFATLVVDTYSKSKLDKSKVVTFLRRLTMENPDFSDDPLTAIGIMYFFTIFFTSVDNIDSTNITEFNEFWHSMILKSSVKKSISRIDEIYWLAPSKNGLLVFNRDDIRVKTGFNYPKQLLFAENLYLALVQSQGNQPPQARE